jgi:hypothetical protein
MKYPEHEKLEIIQAQSQVIGEFLEWLTGTRELILAHYPILESNGKASAHLFPAPIKQAKLIAEFFGIDLTKLEKEKRAMLDILRNGGGK